jgi:hypothetical protein
MLDQHEKPENLTPSVRGIRLGAFVAIGLALVLVETALLGQTIGFGLAVAAGTAWGIGLLISTRYDLFLLGLLLYMTLLEGYLKLRFGGEVLTALRDGLLYSVAIAAVVRWSLDRRPIRPPMLTGWVVLWIGIVFIQLVNPSSHGLPHTIEAMRPHLEFVPLFFFGYWVMRSGPQLTVFLLALVVVAALNGVVSLVQSTLTPEQFAGWGPGYAERLTGGGDVAPRAFVDSEGVRHPRPFGLGGDMGFGGALGALAAPALLALVALRKGWRWRVLWVFLAVGLALAILTSASRTAVITALLSIVGFVVLVAFTSPRRRLIAVVSIGLLAVMLLAGTVIQTQSPILERYSDISPSRVLGTIYDYRKDTVSLIPQYARDFPFGAGLGSVGPAADLSAVQADLNGESEYTFLLVEVGVAGLLTMLALHLHLLVGVLRGLRALPSESQLALSAITAGIVAMFLGWFVGTKTASVPDAPYLWFGAGILAFWVLEPYRPLVRERPLKPSEPVSAVRAAPAA